MRLAISSDRRRGRGASSNISGRFESEVREIFDDGWETACDLPAFRTTVREEVAKAIITRNASPDISFDQSINPYRGCEHGCIYCYARPSHTYLGWSAGLDFESQLTAKVNAAAALKSELSKPNYRVSTIALGANTDPYQPIERERRITRQVLEVLDRTNHPVGIVTKSALILRDLDILASMAQRDLVKVAVSVTSLDRKLCRTLEPRAATVHRRLATLRTLSEADVPTMAMMAPIIPGLTDCEIEPLLAAVMDAGAHEAGYVLLRLPLEIHELFEEWLAEHYPDRARRVMKLMREMRGGATYESGWHVRQRGRGPFADQIAGRFKLTARRLGLNRDRKRLRTDLFERPLDDLAQMSLF